MKPTNVSHATDPMHAAKPVLAIILGYGTQVSLRAYVQGVAAAKANPKATFPRGLTGFWPVSGAEISRQFLAGVHDRINLRGKVSTAYRQENSTRLRRRAAVRVPCECRWCGQPIPYTERERRFCDADCRSSFRS